MLISSPSQPMSRPVDVSWIGPSRPQGSLLTERRLGWCLTTMNQPPSESTGYLRKSAADEPGKSAARSTPSAASSSSATSSRTTAGPSGAGCAFDALVMPLLRGLPSSGGGHAAVDVDDRAIDVGGGRRGEEGHHSRDLGGAGEPAH